MKSSAVTNFGLALDRILLALWVGALWTVGFVVAPVLFNELDRSTAGTVAGILFQYLNWGGLAVGVFLLVRARLATEPRGAASLLLVLMLLSVLLHQFVFAPEIATLREAGFAEGSAAATRFGRLHAAASVSYLINAVFGLLLLVIWRRGGRP